MKRSVMRMHSRLGWLLPLLLFAGAGCSLVVNSPTSDGPPPSELATETLTHYQIVSTDGTPIGVVDGVIIDIDRGLTEYAVVRIADPYNFGKGSSGPQDHYLVVPWSHMRPDGAQPQLVVDVTDTVLAAAPLAYEVPNTTTPGWDAAIEQFWAEQQSGTAE